jgi:hypothetical protein
MFRLRKTIEDEIDRRVETASDFNLEFVREFDDCTFSAICHLSDSSAEVGASAPAWSNGGRSEIGHWREHHGEVDHEWNFEATYPGRSIL